MHPTGMQSCLEMQPCQCYIYGRKGRASPSLFFYIYMQFLVKVMPHNRSLLHALGLASPPENPGSATVCIITSFSDRLRLLTLGQLTKVRKTVASVHMLLSL